MSDRPDGGPSPLVRDGPERFATNLAAATLGWAGVALPQLTVFGCTLVPIVELDIAVHRERVRDGDGPQLDGDVLAMWEWPESPGPDSAVRLSGALFAARRGFLEALAQARQWRPFGPAAVLAPGHLVAAEINCWECAIHGVGLVAADPIPPGRVGDVAHVPAEPGRRAPARRRTADRWIEETLYGLAIRCGALVDPPTVPVR